MYEVLPVDGRLRERILGGAGPAALKAEALRAGLRTLRMDGARKAAAGETTVEEVLRVTQMDTE